MFLLRKMILAELNYAIYNKEVFAIVVVFQIQKVYTKKIAKITIFVDNKNLTTFYITKELNRRQIY